MQQLDEAIILLSSLTLGHTLYLKMTTRTRIITLKGDTKMDAFPLLTAGCDKNRPLGHGASVIWSSMHRSSLVGHLALEKVGNGRWLEWVEPTLIGLANGTTAISTLNTRYTEDEVTMAKANLLLGDDVAKPPPVSQAKAHTEVCSNTYTNK